VKELNSLNVFMTDLPISNSFLINTMAQKSLMLWLQNTLTELEKDLQNNGNPEKLAIIYHSISNIFYTLRETNLTSMSAKMNNPYTNKVIVSSSEEAYLYDGQAQKLVLETFKKLTPQSKIRFIEKLELSIKFSSHIDPAFFE
jgi:hypothetical protein